MNVNSKQYYVYIMTNKSSTLYVGVTDNLLRRMREHVEGDKPDFCRRYYIDKLVWYEAFKSSVEAIEAEKTIKGWRRSKKLDLINIVNPKWEDQIPFLLE